MATYTDEDLFYAFAKLPEYYIEIGVVSGDTERDEDEDDKKKKKKTTHKEKVMLTNAEIMFINEYGSPLGDDKWRIPPRPVLQMTIDWANKELLEKTIDRAIDAFIASDFDEAALEKELKKMCGRMENYARKLIMSNDGRLPGNAESTIKRKGFDHPLFQTGQLTKAITCHLVKI